jgi:cytoskeletal protein RodZ
MTEENGPAAQAKNEPQSERVGDMLRKERITRRIALETIAKDLKLNVRYVRSLEANDYNDLPADPYIRVYLRSLARYLLLDSEAILKKFYEERGIHDEKFRKGSDTQISITMIQKEKKTSVRPWMVIVGVIVGLAVISFIANRKIGSGTAGGSPAVSAAAPARADSQKTGERKAAATDATEDSIIGKMVGHDSAVVAPASDSAAPAATAIDSLSMGRGILSLEVKAKQDSVWIQVFSDGVSWKNWIKANQTKRCVARDSFNIHVGNNSMLEYTFNGKPFRIQARDVAIFKITRGIKKPEIWNLAKWNSVFKNRT